MSRADWNPQTLLELPPTAGAEVVVPLSGRDDAMANAFYRFAEVRESSGKWLWRLDRVEEWLPPMSPQEKARQFTDAAFLPPLTPDGRTDFKAVRERREQEWREHEAAQ